MSRRLALLFACPALMLAATPAGAKDRKVDISPHIDIGQVVTADLTNDDVLTYTTVTAGVDATVQTKRVQVQLNYNYTRQIAYDDKLQNADVHSGIARVAAQVAPGFTVEAGGLATRSRVDNRGADTGNLQGNPQNIAQVYSAYVGPSFSNRFGALDVSAGYRFGYTKVSNVTDINLRSGQRQLDRYDDSTAHVATASVGSRAGALLPVGVTVSGAWEQENTKQLDQRYNGKYARGDLVLPLTRTVALTGGAGYEKIDISQRRVLTDTNGNPVLDSRGRFVMDSSSPRRTIYSTDGVFWDAGLIWRPTTRFEFEARIGRRYDTMSYTGSLSWQTSASSGLQVGVYDSIDSFGRQLSDRLAALPIAPYLDAGNTTDNFNGCVFAGGSGNGSAGGCLNGVFQSIATANFRSRGVDAIFSASRGQSRFGIGLGYANRRYLADSTSAFSVDGLTDESYYAQAFAARAIGRNAGVNGDVYVNYYQSGLDRANGVWGAGANGSLYRRFGRLNAQVTAGVYASDQPSQSSTDVSMQAQLGLGYRF